MHHPAAHHGYSGSNATTTSNGTYGTHGAHIGRWDGAESVRTGSDFWAGGARADGSFSTSQDSMGANASTGTGTGANGYASRGEARPRRPSGESFHPMDDDDDDVEEHVDVDEREQEQEQHGEDGRRTPQAEEHVREVEEALDEEGAHAAFVAGMIWALSRRILPGPPYVPGLVGPDGETKSKDGVVDTGLRWRLDECLRYVVLDVWCV